MALGLTQALIEEYQECSWPARRADNFTAICEPIV
jgi:hypothetical protein